MWVTQKDTFYVVHSPDKQGMLKMDSMLIFWHSLGHQIMFIVFIQLNLRHFRYVSIEVNVLNDKLHLHYWTTLCDMSAQMHGKRILKLLQKIFSWLPLATVIDQKVLILHGGISDTTDLSVLARVDRHKVRKTCYPSWKWLKLPFYCLWEHFQVVKNSLSLWSVPQHSPVLALLVRVSSEAS